MREEAKKKFLGLLERYGETVIRTSAEWVTQEARDLQGKRPIEETERLCTAAFNAYKSYIRSGDYQPLETFIHHVVEMRGEMSFYLSTPQRGMLSFKKALLPILKAEIADIEERSEIIEAIDGAFELVLFDLSDKYQDKVIQNMRLLADRAEESSRAKSDFLARMSHEIRTPLNAILGFSQLLSSARLRTASIEEIDEYFSTIRESARVLDTLIDNILDLAKIESGRMAIDLEEIDLERLVEGVAEIGRAEASEKQVVFSRRIDPALPRYIRCDGRKLNQILMNLTTNAIKFTPREHAVQLSISHASTPSPKLLIKVSDEGIGIPKDMQSVIFEAFEQGSTDRSRSQRGVGLGLAITHRLVELLGGWVSLESEPGFGSTFTVTLPLMEASAIVAARSEIDWGVTPRWPEKVVVVVDDDESSRRLLAVLLEDLGMSVHGASTGAEGVDLVARTDPSLVFVDIHLPDFDGIRVTEAIRTTPGRERTPIAIITGDATTTARSAAHDAGIVDYLTKPLQLKALFGVLQKHFGDS
jgi:signal transduction histidine kinase/ActR/RegA family two-component response regulator